MLETIKEIENVLLNDDNNINVDKYDLDVYQIEYANNIYEANFEGLENYFNFYQFDKEKNEWQVVKTYKLSNKESRSLLDSIKAYCYNH